MRWTNKREAPASSAAAPATYLTSEVHARGADLERLAALASRQPAVRALDLGCGAGHASFALARGGVQRVTAFDPSPADAHRGRRGSGAARPCTRSTSTPVRPSRCRSPPPRSEPGRHAILSPTIGPTCRARWPSARGCSCLAAD